MRIRFIPWKNFTDYLNLNIHTITSYSVMYFYYIAVLHNISYKDPL